MVGYEQTEERYLHVSKSKPANYVSQWLVDSIYIYMLNMFFVSLCGCTGLPYFKNLCICTHTSSAAQGGGGSFKKRKTIGEIGCCESQMSKQKH